VIELRSAVLVRHFELLRRRGKVYTDPDGAGPAVGAGGHDAVGALLDRDARIRTFPYGDAVRELIVDVDEQARRLAYSVVDGARMPLSHHHASCQVFADGTQGSRLVWITKVQTHSLAAEVRARRGGHEMKRTEETLAHR
jgi:hypothetical protein